MTSVTPPANSRRSTRNSKRSSKRWWAAAIVLLLTCVAFFTVGLGNREDQPAGPAANPHASQPGYGHPTPTPPAGAPVVARSVPVGLRIPAIGVSTSLSTLGLNPDKTVEVPTNYQEPGWYRLGPTPGQVGSAVILGHVDDKKGPAVFYRLRTLKAGDKVDVSLANGVIAHFVVKTVEIYPKDQFPAQLVYTSHGYSALQLVTCGGRFDAATGHYESNIVAYTTLTSTTPPTAT